MTILLLRLAWNSAEWRHPTGELLNKESSYVGKHGFGHEDWNFATTDLIDEQVLGYVRYNPSNARKDLGEALELLFFSKKPGGERYLVGRYRNAKFLDQAAREANQRKFAKSSILDKRIDELLALNLPNIKRQSDARKYLLSDFSSNISVAPSDIEIFHPTIKLTPALLGGRDPRWISRYGAPITLESLPNIDSRKGTPNQTDRDKMDEEAYCRFTEAQMKVIRRMHNQLSNRFRLWLSGIGAEGVVAESNSVDVECQFKKQTYLFELKTTASQVSRLALRDAIGQILEYSYFPGRCKKHHLVIVLDAEPSSEEIEWIATLNKAAPPIELMWLVGNGVRSASLTNSPLSQLASVNTKSAI